MKYDFKMVAVVFPTCVGMNRIHDLSPRGVIGVPHMRGDEPFSDELCLFLFWCSPHAWG